MLLFVAWFILAVLAWPLAVLALLAYPLVWLLTIPLRLVGVTVSGAIDLAGAILRLPARVVRG